MTTGADIAARIAQLRKEADEMCVALCVWHLREARRKAAAGGAGWVADCDKAYEYAHSLRDDSVKYRILAAERRVYWRAYESRA